MPLESRKNWDITLLLVRAAYTLVLVLMAISPCYAGIQIETLIIPERIENGTVESVILDCIYTLDEATDRILAVKWYFSDDPEPIYQWIPEFESRIVSKRLLGRINMDFAANSVSPFTKYRAMNILRPTIDLSGRYSCQVDSLTDQASREKNMVVYVRPKNFKFNFTRIAKDEAKAFGNGNPLGHNSNRQRLVFDENDLSHGAILKCFVGQVYPMPHLRLYRISKDGRKINLTNTKMKADQDDDGAYNVELSAQLIDYEHVKKYGKEPSLFECHMNLDLNGVNITKAAKITYFPASEKKMLNQTSSYGPPSPTTSSSQIL